MSSIDDELASIERPDAGAQRISSSIPDSPVNRSEVVLINDARQISNDGDRRDNGKAKQRNSLDPMSMMELFDDCGDLGESDDESEPRNEEEDRQQLTKAPNPKASGGPEHRPLVGGFAAAAYEASRADFYKKQGIAIQNKQVF